MFLILLSGSLVLAAPPLPPVPGVGQDDFDKVVLKSPRPVVVTFSAGWCVACRQLAPTLEELQSEYQGKVIFAKVTEDDKLQERYKITALPTCIVFVRGQAYKRIEGNGRKSMYTSFLDRLLEDIVPLPPTD